MSDLNQVRLSTPHQGPARDGLHAQQAVLCSQGYRGKAGWGCYRISIGSNARAAIIYNYGGDDHRPCLIKAVTSRHAHRRNHVILQPFPRGQAYIHGSMIDSLQTAWPGMSPALGSNCWSRWATPILGRQVDPSENQLCRGFGMSPWAGTGMSVQVVRKQRTSSKTCWVYGAHLVR